MRYATLSITSLLLALTGFLAAPVQAREAVIAADPHDVSVTIYRDPDRDEDEEMDADNPGGFAMISETRMVDLPAGESRILFDGVAEGMVGVSAIVTGLPGGTIEKNRNAELLSPAALVNGALGNRVTITRHNPATGQPVSEQAIVRTRADGGLVLQSSTGFEAVRCAGLPETLSFDGVPTGLSAKPIFSIDTRDDRGGRYEVTLTYLAWGFDWQANYVATMPVDGTSQSFDLGLLSWLTVLNDNGQSFNDAQLLVVAGELNVVSNYQALARPPSGEALSLTCYPLGSTAAGSPVVNPAAPPALRTYAPYYERDDGAIIVTATRRNQGAHYDTISPLAVVSSEAQQASEENLGDLKLYRVPERVDVAAQGQKQIAFLNRSEVGAGLIYRINCDAGSMRGRRQSQDTRPTSILLVTKNEEERDLGVALPQGPLNLFEPSSRGPLLVGQSSLRDYAVGQDVELRIGQSLHVRAGCIPASSSFRRYFSGWQTVQAKLTNSNDTDVTLRIVLGSGANWDFRWSYGETRVKDGLTIAEFTLPAGAEWPIEWHVRRKN